MEGNGLIELWELARRDLGLKVVIPFELEIRSSVKIRAEFLLKNFGGRVGMLIVTNYDSVEPFLGCLHELGYGFSVLSEPKEGQVYVRDDFIEMLSDWSWSGPLEQKPIWLQDRKS